MILVIGLTIALIVSEKIGFSWKICENFSFGCRSEEKNDVAQKILTQQSCDGQTICSVHYSEKNSISSFSILSMVWAAGSRKWNFSVFWRIFTDDFWRISAKVFVLEKNIQQKSCRSLKNNWSRIPVLFL